MNASAEGDRVGHLDKLDTTLDTPPPSGSGGSTSNAPVGRAASASERVETNTVADERTLDAWCAEIEAEPTRIRTRFPAAAREIGRTPGTSAEPGAERVEDGVRLRLLAALGGALAGDPDALSIEVHDLYRFGDADERRAVLLGLGQIEDLIGDRALDLVHDALRTNDPRLVAAALGTYASRLDDAAWRQAVLKCLFVGVPLRLVAGLERADDELRRMVADYAAERRAAGREVPADALSFLPAPTQTTRES
ncbi:hypothetical protein SAMN05428985_106391 [Nocardioides sp. YR527]|uniref:EboA domain-containing protein n=1 Tax=Nocardioides sp. YR527 TaxID=1881028 RepID=UPI000890FEB3|nr:EboA domain-containing protein [Nocardioides sp. YR527]SDK85687.1 hypothetical protein SAMN05428985_106391 [Nocardioides sp. YR527]